MRQRIQKKMKTNKPEGQERSLQLKTVKTALMIGTYMMMVKKRSTLMKWAFRKILHTTQALILIGVCLEKLFTVQ